MFNVWVIVVWDVLVSLKVDFFCLSVKGFGEDCFIFSNKMEFGKVLNWRVEFVKK